MCNSLNTSILVGNRVINYIAAYNVCRSLDIHVYIMICIFRQIAECEGHLENCPETLKPALVHGSLGEIWMQAESVCES